jgi:TrmH family RNA methyltransferase
MTPIDNIVFILDRPQDVVNVGAVVRLMGNFGVRQLRLVELAAFDPERILTIARRGQAVLEATRRYATLEAALADCAFVLGTTSRARALARPVLTPRQAAPALLAVGMSGVGDGAVSPRVAAVLFGPENFGLANEALDRCHALLRIPTVPHDASLNLAQAALLVAYELHLTAFGGDAGGEAEPATAHTQTFLRAVARAGELGADGAMEALAVGAELEPVFSALHHMLEALHGTLIPGRTAVLMARLRALLLRAAPRADEAALLAELFEHVARTLRTRGETGSPS